ncbi:MAG TPA: tetratricopeptide repeat protein [Burkholderiales bacterium]|nr:tetratricopeptide repeat protein [Burkholderiales bacterium]
MTLPAVRLFALVVALLIGCSAGVPASAQVDELQDANQLFKQGQLDRALDRVNAYLGKNPKDARGRFLKGIILTEQSKPNDAIKVFTELTQDFPELPEPYNNLAVLYASQGQYDKARAALEMAIRTHPSYATAHENLGDIYAKMASQAYDKALQLDKNNATAQTKLNLIKELFPAARPARTSAKGEPPAKVATAPEASKPAPAQPPQSASKAAEPPVKAAAPVESTPRTAATSEPPAKSAAAPKESTAKTVAAIEPAKPAAKQNSEEVLKAVNRWAKAWSEKDVDGYLAHYSADFKTPRGENRGAWEAERKARIAKPRSIEVAIESPKVTFTEANRVTVTFRQHYNSGSLKVASIKTLVMVKAGEKWLIQQERAGS